MATRVTTILVALIVGATFIAGLIVGAQRDDASGPVDLIIVNGKVYPGGGAQMQEAVAVRGNQILRVGSNRDVKRLRRPQTMVIDAHGATVLPGLNDTQVEVLAGALGLDQLDLAPAATLDDIETELRHYAEVKPTSAWIVGRNGDTELLSTASAPARRFLDEAVDDRPVVVTSADKLTAWANSKALELAGIDRKTRNPKSGIVVRDRRTGEPTGVLKDQAVGLVTGKVPPATRPEKIAALRQAIDLAHSVGVTSLQSVSASEDELRLLDEIRQKGELTVRVYATIALPPTFSEAEILELNELREEFPDDPTLKLGGILVMCPCTREVLQRAAALLDKYGWQMMIRTVDGSDVHHAVDALEQVGNQNAGSGGDRRNRLDETLLSGGSARILLGSNWPAASLDPRESIEQAVTTTAELRNAIDAYTSHAAFASFDEQRKGTLAKGMLADIVILSNDIFEAVPDALRETAVTVTIFDGKIVYQRPASGSN
jgi:predicted amidohydrolase YtcJ